MIFYTMCRLVVFNSLLVHLIFNVEFSSVTQNINVQLIQFQCLVAPVQPFIVQVKLQIQRIKNTICNPVIAVQKW